MAEQGWEAQAYVLWRRRGLDVAAVHEFLKLEGWKLDAEDIELVLMERAGRELRAFFSTR